MFSLLGIVTDLSTGVGSLADILLFVVSPRCRATEAVGAQVLAERQENYCDLMPYIEIL